LKYIIILFTLFGNLLYANITYTVQEQEFIKNTNIKCITTNTWAPFNMSNKNNQLDGLALDYLKIIIKKSNLKINCNNVDSWSTVLNKIKNKESDFTIATIKSKDKENFANFSKPYLSYPIAIATTLDKVFISNEEYLSNKRIAVGKGYSAYYILKAKYKNIKFTIVNNTDEALKLLSEGKVDAAVDILPVLSYNITKLGLANIKITGITKHNFDVRFMFKNNKEFEPLISILNKTIDNITIDEKRIIADKWTNVQFNKEIDYEMIFKIAIPLFLLLIYFIFNNKKLQKEIKLRILTQKKLEEIVNIDGLTGVYNRHYLNIITDELISNANRHKEELVFLIMDIDDFKGVNDTYGHIAGDDVLKQVTNKLKELTRPSDIIIRYGGEEFLVILKKTSPSDAYTVAEKLRVGVKNLVISSSSIQEKINVTISSGLVSYNYNNYLSIKEAIHDADLALYQAKNEGKNRTIIYKGN